MTPRSHVWLAGSDIPDRVLTGCENTGLTTRENAALDLTVHKPFQSISLLGTLWAVGTPWGFASVKNRIIVRGEQGKRRTAS